MLNYTITGDTGPIIVIVHGLYGSGRNWGVIAKRLSNAFRVVTPDLRNHGHSLHSDVHSYAAMAHDLEELITHLGAPVCLCGHSMGGKASMVLALTRPDLVARLLVADIAPVPYTHSQLEHIVAMRAVDLSAVTRRSDAAQQLAAQGTPPALQSFFTQSLDVPGRSWLLNLDALADNMDAIMGFPTIEAQFEKPTLFLSGADSDYVQTAHRPTIKSLFPKARFARIAEAGHWLHADKPREFEATLRAFASA
jgi:pimeloyl-ACP methyl ester carboxylesterase